MRRVGTLLIAAATGLCACVEQDITESPDPAFAADAADRTPSTIRLEKIGGFAHGGALAAEITAYDDVSRRLFVVNGALGTVDVLDLRNPASPVRLATLDVGGGVNSVATSNGIVALAVEAPVKQNPGKVVFYRATTLQPVSEVQVGALPDMLAFTPDGRYVVVANEGEPNDAYTVDPEGSVSVIDVRNINRPTVRTADFRAWIGREDELRAAGVRIFGPNANAAQDLEPEYVAISADSRTAYVTLQENNAVAVVDIASATVTRIMPLGWKDHSVPGNGIDATEDGQALIRTWPVRGLYMPDAIDAYDVGGQTFLVTANEGDAREYAGFPPNGEETIRINNNNVVLNPDIFTTAACNGASCKSNNQGMGRLQIIRNMGRNPATGEYDAVYSLGARSISIWTASGQQVWDSGDDIERRTVGTPGAAFNANNTLAGNNVDARSGNKGPEPEGVVLGRLGAKTYAFVGLERIGGVIVYDVTNPMAPFFVTYVNTRPDGDLGPEGVMFIPAVRSPNKHPLVIVGNEVSGTTTIFRVHLD